MDLRWFTYLVTMPDLRLARERMKMGNEKGRLEGYLLLCAAVIVGAFRACLEAEHVYLPFIVGGVVVFVILMVVTIVRPAKSDEKDGKPGYTRPEEVSFEKEMNAVYTAAFLTFVVLVTFYLWAEYYPHVGAPSFFNQYAEYIFVGGIALICILVVFARRKLRKKKGGIIEGM